MNDRSIEILNFPRNMVQELLDILLQRNRILHLRKVQVFTLNKRY